MGKTDQHEWPTPNDGDSNYEDTFQKFFEQVDDAVEIRGVDSDKTNHSPVAGAKFVATDTEKVYVGDGSNWNHLATTGKNPTVDSVTASTDVDAASYKQGVTESKRPLNLRGYRFLQNPPKHRPRTPTIAWTLDDGRQSVYDERSIWDTVNIDPMVAPITNFLDGNSGNFGWDELDTLVNDLGWELANHGKTGDRPDNMTTSELENEILGSTEDFLDKGYDPLVWTRPFGESGGDDGLAIISQVYSHALGVRDSGVGLTSDGTVQYKGYSAYDINRVSVDNTDLSVIQGKIDDAIAANTSVILVSHDIIQGTRSDETSLETATEKIKDIAAYARNNGMEWGGCLRRTVGNPTVAGRDSRGWIHPTQCTERCLAFQRQHSIRICWRGDSSRELT